MKIDWNTGLVAHLGMEFLEVTPERIVARLKVTDKLLTTTDTVHGGTLMAFADTVGATATSVNLPPVVRGVELRRIGLAGAVRF